MSSALATGRHGLPVQRRARPVRSSSRAGPPPTASTERRPPSPSRRSRRRPVRGDWSRITASWRPRRREACLPVGREIMPASALHGPDPLRATRALEARAAEEARGPPAPVGRRRRDGGRHLRPSATGGRRRLQPSRRSRAAGGSEQQAAGPGRAPSAGCELRMVQSVSRVGGQPEHPSRPDPQSSVEQALAPAARPDGTDLKYGSGTGRHLRLCPGSSELSSRCWV